jgi:undecaprenyl-phosphate 4-deoxy-4-formamido-L-arabinose transferase
MGLGNQGMTLHRAASAPEENFAFALSVVIPVYNGANSVPVLVQKLSELKVEDPDYPGGMEIILVVDGSPDHSITVCRELCKKLRTPITVANLSRNFGEHNAVMAGFSLARGAYLINMDDDLQNPPEEVINLWRYTRDNRFDVVYTCYAEKQHAGWRNLGSQFTNWCADTLLDKPKGIYLSSFRCISAFTAKAVLNHTGPFPYIDGLIMQVTQNIGSLTVKHLPRAGGKSNYTLARLLRLFLSMFLNFSVIPLRIASIAGAVVGIAGFIALVWILIEALGGGTPRGWAFMTASLLFLTGTQLIMFGLMGEYIGRMFLTTNKRPQFIIRDVTDNHSPAQPR